MDKKTIYISPNRYHSWDHEWKNQYRWPKGANYAIYLGPDTQLVDNPTRVIAYYKYDVIGVILEMCDIHDRIPESKSPLGTAYYYGGFFVLRQSPQAQPLLDCWKEVGEISEAIWRMRIRPQEYPAGIIKPHIPLNSYPKIIWKDSDKT